MRRFLAALVTALGMLSAPWAGEVSKRASGTSATPDGREWMAPIGDSLSGSAGRVEHTVVIPSAKSAYLRINVEDLWAAERGGPTVTRVVLNGKQYDEPATRQNRPSFPLPADEHAVQRLLIDGMPVLLHVRAGEELWFQSNPCSSWLLASQRLDMYAAGTAYVRFSSRIGGTVRLGYHQDGAFKETRRVQIPSDRGTEYYPVHFNHCRFAAVKFGDEIILALENRAKWSLNVLTDG